MRVFAALLALFFLSSSCASRQPLIVDEHSSRPAFAVSGRETMPMMMVDEAALGDGRFEELVFPRHIWEDMKACAEAAGYDVSRVDRQSPPRLVVVPAARTIRVHDMTLDSLLYAEDSTFVGEKWSSPTIGYALIRSNAIVVTSTFKRNKYLLRHEALHFIVWRSTQVLGHPDDLFWPCDRAYE